MSALFAYKIVGNPVAADRQGDAMDISSRN